MTFVAFPDAQPLHGLAGGILIGLAAAMMLLGAWRIAGVSGIIARATGLCRGDMSMTPLSVLPFLVAMLAGMAIHNFLPEPGLRCQGAS